VTAILAFDTSAGACAVAVWRDGVVLASSRAVMARGHAERLMPAVQTALAAAGLGYAALDAIAVTTGPGAFTGIRIGLAAARGLALAAARPAIGVTVFAAVAAAVPPARRRGRDVLVVVDTKRDDVYAQRLDGDTLAPRGEAAVLDAAGLAAAAAAGRPLLAGDGVALARRWQGEAIDAEPPATADPATVAAFAATALERHRSGGEVLPPALPLYIRSVDATPLELQGKRR
jgi:tRNA threonylcarbamoyladenosine biosynthesis protein TsaB